MLVSGLRIVLTVLAPRLDFVFNRAYLHRTIISPTEDEHPNKPQTSATSISMGKHEVYMSSLSRRNLPGLGKVRRNLFGKWLL